MSEPSSEQPVSIPLNPKAIERIYPEDMRTLPTMYSNHAAVIVSNTELVVDFFQLQPQTVADGKVEAVAMARIIMSPQQARKYFQAGIKALDQSEKL